MSSNFEYDLMKQKTSTCSGVVDPDQLLNESGIHLEYFAFNTTIDTQIDNMSLVMYNKYLIFCLLLRMHNMKAIQL